RSSPASFLVVGKERSLSRRARKQRAGPSRKPVRHESEPFADGDVRTYQPVGGKLGEGESVGAAPDVPVDRIGRDRKADLAEQADRTRHVIGRGYQQPALAGLRIGQLLAEHGVLVSV